MIEECSRNALLWSETFWVLYYRAAERDFGYNMAFPIKQRMPAERMSALHREIMARPGMRERTGQSVKKTLSERLDILVKAIAATKEYYAIPENNAKRSEQSKALWRDESMREQLLASQAAIKSTPEFRRKMSEIKKQQMDADPTIKEKISNSRKAQYQNDLEYVARVMVAAKNPERNKAISDKAKARWADPEFRARTGKAISAGKRAK